MPRNRFTNPATGAYYDWHINHDAEEAEGRTRNVEYTARTGNVGLVHQQGDDAPLVLKYSGKILQAAQLASMIAYYNLCSTQTVIFTDAYGDSYEVIITAFQPRRLRAVKNPRDATNPTRYWEYSIEMSVLRVIAGPWVGTPI